MTVAVITGGGSGIGEAICHRFAGDGALVAALDVRLDAARRTIAAIGAGLAVQADVSDSAAVDDALARVERELGPIDVLVNNAGAVGGAHLDRVMPHRHLFEEHERHDHADLRRHGGDERTPRILLDRLERGRVEDRDRAGLIG